MLKPRQTLAQAITDFLRRNENGQIVSRQTGEPTKLSPRRVSVVLSHVRSAVRYAAQTSNPDSVRLGPYLETLPDLARRGAEEAGRARPANEVADVRLFLEVIERRTSDRRTRRRARADSFLPGWRPLFTALDRCVEKAQRDRFRRYAGYLYAFQDFLVLHDVRGPEDLPDYTTLREWLDEGGHSRKSLDNWLTAFRVARTLAGRTDLPTLEAPPSARERGVRSLADLDGRLLARGCRKPAADLTTRQIIGYLAPAFGEALDAYLERAQLQRKSPDWQNAVESTLSCIIAELIRMGQDPHDLDPVDLYTVRQAVSTNSTVRPLLRRRIGKEQAGIAQHVLMRRFVDEAARRSAHHSPISLAGNVEVGCEVPFYPTAIWNNAVALWAVVREVYGLGCGDGGMIEHAPDEWRTVESEHERLMDHMAQLNGQRQTTGHKNKALVSITWAQAVCIGLRHLWLQAHEARDAYFVKYERACKAGLDNPTSVRNARRRYYRALEDYVLAAVLLDDGLRVKQYANGLCNVHFVPTVVQTAQGEQIVEVETRWRGYDPDETNLKGRTENGGERVRSRSLSPGIVDMDLLTEYWLEARPHRLAARGLIPDVESYELSEDRFAFFVSTSSTSATGSYSPGRLSLRFGRCLHRFMTLMGRKVPAWQQLRADRDLRRKWRGLFGAHVTRQLLATYLGGIREKWSLVAYLTNDRVLTLQNYYVQFKGAVAEAMKREGVEHPHHFDGVMDDLLAGKVIDWRGFDPQVPAKTPGTRPSKVA